MKPEKKNKSVESSQRSEGALVDLLNTEIRQLQDAKLIEDLKKLVATNPGGLYEGLLDLLNRRQEELTRTYYFLAQSQGRELDYIQRNSELLKKNTSLTNRLDSISDKYKLYKDAHETIKQKAASLFKENKELKTKLTSVSNEGALQLAFAIENDLAYYDDKDTFSKEYILTLISDILKQKGCKVKERSK